MKLKDAEFEHGTSQLSRKSIFYLSSCVNWFHEKFSRNFKPKKKKKKISHEAKEKGFIMGTYVGKNIVLLLRNNWLCILTDWEASAREKRESSSHSTSTTMRNKHLNTPVKGHPWTSPNLNSLFSLWNKDTSLTRTTILIPSVYAGVPPNFNWFIHKIEDWLIN